MQPVENKRNQPTELPPEKKNIKIESTTSQIGEDSLKYQGFRGEYILAEEEIHAEATDFTDRLERSPFRELSIPNMSHEELEASCTHMYGSSTESSFSDETSKSTDFERKKELRKQRLINKFNELQKKFLRNLDHSSNTHPPATEIIDLHPKLVEFDELDPELEKELEDMRRAREEMEHAQENFLTMMHITTPHEMDRMRYKVPVSARTSAQEKHIPTDEELALDILSVKIDPIREGVVKKT